MLGAGRREGRVVTISFEVKARNDGPLGVTPLIDGRLLSELVDDYEAAKGLPDTGEHGGIVPAWFRYGPLDAYFLGAPDDDWDELGGRYLLGCAGCGEVGCNPFVGRIEAGPAEVVWSAFGRDIASEPEYAELGPFVFERRAYDAALRDLIAQLGS